MQGNYINIEFNGKDATGCHLGEAWGEGKPDGQISYSPVHVVLKSRGAFFTDESIVKDLFIGMQQIAKR